MSFGEGNLHEEIKRLEVRNEELELRIVSLLSDMTDLDTNHAADIVALTEENEELRNLLQRVWHNYEIVVDYSYQGSCEPMLKDEVAAFGIEVGHERTRADRV